MKKYFKSLLTLLTMAAAVVATSCSSADEGVTITPPTFPEQVHGDLDRGGVQEVTFTADRDWTIELTSATLESFWLIDGDFTSTTLRGTAGEYTIQVATADKVYLADESCEVKLTMDGPNGPESEIIATISIAKTILTLDIYTAQIDTDGSFVYDTNPDDEIAFAYNTEAVSETTLHWPKTGSLSMPILIDASFDWTPYGSDIPSWLTLTKSEGAEGKTEFFANAVLSAVPVEGAETTLTFGIESFNKSLKITTPNLQDLWMSNFSETYELTYNGMLNNPDGASIGISDTFISAKGVKFFYAEKIVENQWSTYYNVSETPSWLTVTDEFTEGNSADNRRVSITIVEGQENTAATAREMTIVAVPEHVWSAADFKTWQIAGMAIEPAFEKYVLTTIINNGYQAIYTDNSADELEKQGLLYTATSEAWVLRPLGAQSGFDFTVKNHAKLVDPIGTLVFDSNFKGETLSVEYYNIENPTLMTAEESWMTFKWVDQAAGKFQIEVDPAKDSFNYMNFSIYTQGYHEGYVKLSFGGDAIFIRVIVNPEAQIGDSFTVAPTTAFEGHTGLNFETIEEGHELYEQYAEFITTNTQVYLLEYSEADVNAQFDVTAIGSLMKMPGTAAGTDNNWLTYEKISGTQMSISMTQPTAEQKQSSMIQVLDSSWNMKAIIHCRWAQ